MEESLGPLMNLAAAGGRCRTGGARFSSSSWFFLFGLRQGSGLLRPHALSEPVSAVIFSSHLTEITRHKLRLMEEIECVNR